MSPEARAWLRARTPPPPDVFRPWLERPAPRTRPGKATSSLSGELAAAGRAALARVGGAERRPRGAAGGAEAGPGREPNAAAFLLLEADALVTYACEAAADAPDPGAALEEVLRTMVEADVVEVDP